MLQGKFQILNTSFNQENYPGMIGQRFDNPPAYAEGKWERDLLDDMEDTELVAYWNILQMGQRMIRNTEAHEQGERHIPILTEILTEREIPHENGKQIATVRVKRLAA